MINNTPTTSANSLDTSSCHEGQGKRNATQLNHGTSAVEFIYQGGIVMCSDSRITQSMLKAMPVSDHIMATLVGGAANCSFWIRTLAWESQRHELRHGEPLPLLSAASAISKWATEERVNGRNLCMGMIVAGRDKSGLCLFRIDSEGFIIQGTAFAVGRGSAKALDILDDGFDHNLTDKQAFDLGIRAVYCAVMADDTSGGSVSLHHMSKAAWKTVAIMDCKELQENFTRGLDYAGEHMKDTESQPPQPS